MKFVAYPAKNSENCPAHGVQIDFEGWLTELDVITESCAMNGIRKSRNLRIWDT